MAYRDGVDEDWTDEERWPWWRAVLGIVIATFVALGSTASQRIGHQSYLPGELPGWIFGTVLLFYGILYFTALRRARMVWKIIGFVLVLLAVLIGTAGGPRMRIGDISHLGNDVEAMIDGRPVAPGANDGTLASVIRELMVKSQADQGAYAAELEAAGANALLNPATLARQPDVLKHCDRIEGLVITVATHRQRALDHMAETREALSTRAGANAAELAAYDAGNAARRPAFDRQWVVEQEQLTDLAAMCRVLARRRWQSGADFVFTHRGDYEEYRGITERFNIRAREAQRLKADAAAAMRRLATSSR